MSLHNGSSQMAHNLDRFSFDSKFEQIAADAARLQITPNTIRKYLDWYGEQPVTVVNKHGMKSMPAYRRRSAGRCWARSSASCARWNRPVH